MTLGPTLTTARLVLRPPQLSDFDAWAAFHADPETAAYVGGVQARSVAWRGFAGLVGSWALLGFGMFSVLERSSGRWVGRAGPWRPEGWPGPEVGWGLAKAFQGRGYALEAAQAATSWAFDTLGWGEVIHVIQLDNVKSIRLAERLGSTPRGRVQLPAPNETLVCHAWGQSREAWRKRWPSLLIEAAGDA